VLAWKLKELHAPAEDFPRLARVAEQLSTPVVVLTGLMWGSFLAAFTASVGDDLLRDTFAEAMYTASSFFFLASMLQIAHGSLGRTALSNALAGAAYAAIGVVSLFFLSGQTALVMGMNDGKSSEFSELSRKKIECYQEKNTDLAKAAGALQRATIDWYQCINASSSDLVMVELAVAEKRITEEQQKTIVAKIGGRCDDRKESIGLQSTWIEEVRQRNCQNRLGDK